MSAWVEVAQFTLTKNWQFTNAVEGKFFRVRHLQGRRVFSGWIAQADISDPAVPTLAEVRSLYCKEQGDLYEFPTPIAFGSRAIGVKRLDDSLSLWTLAIDVLDFSVEENPNVYQEFSGAAAALMDLLQGRDFADILAAIAAHEAAENPHPEYALSTELEAALVSRVTDSELATVIANFVTSSQLAAAIADLALEKKQNVITLTQTTLNGSLVEMTVPQRVLIRANSTAGFEVWITGHSQGTTPEFIYWVGSGAIYRRDTAASTVMVSLTGKKQAVLGNGNNWSPTLSADTVNGGLRIQVKGDPGKSVKWVARVHLTEAY
jgi:hypothetical protein